MLFATLLPQKNLMNILKLFYRLIPFKKQIFMEIRKINLSHKIYQHLAFKDKFRVKIEKNKSFLLNHYGFEVENEIFWKGITGSFEKISLDYWIRLSKKSQVILDIGANTGIYSLVAKTVNPQAHIYAFEPVQRVYHKLLENCSLNNYEIDCYEMAISNFDGEATIYDPGTEHIYSVTVNKNNIGSSSVAIPVKIKTQKVSTFIQKNHISKIDLIKIDVESHEPEVLEGIEEYLQLMKPTMIVEVWNDSIGKKIEKIVSNKNYLYFSIDELNQPILTEHIRVPLDKICDRQPYVNYLICQPAVAIDLDLRVPS
jgi:FkbM family methyltransferase